MRRAAIVVPGNHGPAFYSQIAALAAAVRALPHVRWQTSIHAFLGPAEERRVWDVERDRWAPFLNDVRIVDADSAAYAALGNWAQADASLERAPADADMLVCLDADTFPVDSLETLFDEVAEGDLVAGVMAHYPPPGMPSRREWLEIAGPLLTRPLAFEHAYSLLGDECPAHVRAAPFYLNGGATFLARSAFDRFLPLYLRLRRSLMERMAHEAFTGQVAFTLAAVEAGLRTRVLPMRYNFPNDAVAERLHPDDARRVVIHHYLRTTRFDRQRIFTDAGEYARFLGLALDGPDARFRAAVVRVLGTRYPFTTCR